MEKILRVGIDPSGVQTGASVIKRELDTVVDEAKQVVDGLRTIGTTGLPPEKIIVDTERIENSLLGMITELRQANQSLIDVANNTANSIRTVAKAAEEKPLQSLNDALKNLWSDFEGFTTDLNQGIEIMQKLGSGVSAGIGFVKAAAEFEDQAGAITAAADILGINFADLMTQSRAAVSGMVDDYALLGSNATAVQLRVSTSVKELSNLWLIAKNKGDESGKSTVETFNQIVQAIGQGQGRTLIELGILPAEFGRASDSAELLRNRAFLLKTTLSEGNAEIAAMGEATVSTADKIDAFEAQVANAGLALKTTLLPAAESTIDALKATSEWAQKNAETVGSLAGAAAGLTAYIAAIEAATLAQKAFNVALSASPTALAVIGLTALAGALITLQSETDTAEEITRKMGETLLENAEKGSRSSQAQIIQQKEIQLAQLQTLYGQRAIIEEKLRGMNQLAASDPSNSFARGNINPLSATDQLSGAVEASRLRDALQQIDKAQQDLIETKKRYSEASNKERDEMRLYVQAMEDELKERAALDAVIPTSTDKKEKHTKAIKESTTATEAFIDAMKLMSEGVLRGLDLETMRVTKSFGVDFVYGLESAGYTVRNLVKDMFALQDIAAKNTKLGTQIALAAGGIGPLEQTRKITPDEVYELDLAKKISEQKKKIGAAFSDALLEGVRTGTYLEAFKSGLKSAVTEAFSQAFPTFNDKGQFNFGNFGVNMAAGFVTNTLFGAGGLFGTRVTKGQEAVSQASSIDQQTRQAIADRDSITRLIGLSESTIAALNNIAFANAGYTWSDSGNGITSKKTRTYALDAGAALSGLSDFAALSAKAKEESLMKEFTLSLIALASPLKGIVERMNALAQISIDGTTSLEDRLKVETEYQQLQAQLNTMWATRVANWASFLVSNPYAQTDAGVRAAGLQGATKPLTGSNRIEEVSTQDLATMLRGIKVQGSASYEYQRGLSAAGNDLTAQSAMLLKRKDLLSNYMQTLQEIMTDAEKDMVSGSLSFEDRQASLERYREAQNAYYGAAEEAASIEEKVATNTAKVRDEAAAATIATAKKAEDAANEAAAAVKEAQQAQIDALAQYALDTVTFKSSWLTFVENYASLLSSGLISGALPYYFTEKLTAGGMPSLQSNDITQQAYLAQMGGELNLQEKIANIGGGNLSEEALRARMAQADQQAAFFKNVMDISFAQAMDETQAYEVQKAALERAIQAQNDYHNAKLDSLNAEAQMQEEIKAKQEQLKATQDTFISDLLGNLLTTVGELKSISGTQVMFLSKGQVEAREIAKKILDAKQGLEPELREALLDIINGATQ